MKVKIDITRLDYWNFNKYAMMHVPKLKKNFLASMISTPVFVVVFGFILIKYLLQISMPSFAVILICMIGGILADCLMMLITKSQIMKLPAEKSGLLGEHTIEIDTNGVLEKTAVNEGVNTWKGIYNIVQNSAYIFIFTDNITAHIIPKRAFAGEQEAEAFFERAVSLWNKNKA